MEIEKLSKIAKVMSEPKRIEILQLINGNELCANEILEQFNITQPTLSHHMKLLVDCDLVFVRKEGKMSYYTTNTAKFTEIIEKLKKFEDS